MSKKEGVLYLKSVMNEKDYKNMLEGSARAQSEAISDGLSISGSNLEYLKVVDQIGYLRDHEDTYVRGTTKNIIAHAKKESEKGMFDHKGKSIFLID